MHVSLPLWEADDAPTRITRKGCARELTEDPHRPGLTKDQRDEHIRRYAEVLKAQRAIAKPDKPSDFKASGAGRGNKGVASEIAEATGIA